MSTENEIQLHFAAGTRQQVEGVIEPGELGINEGAEKEAVISEKIGQALIHLISEERMQADPLGVQTLMGGPFATADATYSEGSFTATLTNCTAPVTGLVKYVKKGNQVTLTIPAMGGTSNGATTQLTGFPVSAPNLIPATDNLQVGGFMVRNGTSVRAQGMLFFEGGAVNLGYLDATAGYNALTATQAKGFDYPTVITYSLL